MEDEKNIIGTLGTYDHYRRLVLLDAVQRISVGKYYANLALGVFLASGMNYYLLAELDAAKEAETLSGLIEAPIDEVFRRKQEAEEIEKVKKARQKQAWTKLKYAEGPSD